MKPAGITKANQKDHGSRKNPHMAEQFAARRKAKNAERPKQHWVELMDGVMPEVERMKGTWVR